VLIAVARPQHGHIKTRPLYQNPTPHGPRHPRRSTTSARPGIRALPSPCCIQREHRVTCICFCSDCTPSSLGPGLERPLILLRDSLLEVVHLLISLSANFAQVPPIPKLQRSHFSASARNPALGATVDYSGNRTLDIEQAVDYRRRRPLQVSSLLPEFDQRRIISQQPSLPLIFRALA
jgi:hypothetical protein